MVLWERDRQASNLWPQHLYSRSYWVPRAWWLYPQWALRKLWFRYECAQVSKGWSYRRIAYWQWWMRRLQGRNC